MFSFSLNLISQRLVVFTDFTQELLLDNCELSLSLSNPVTSVLICIISCCILYQPIRKIETMTVM